MSTVEAAWIDACAVTELPEGERKIIDHEEKHMMLVNHQGEIYAIESMCSHAMFELDDAEIDNCMITCPLHGADFCLKTGAALCAPATEAIPTYPVKVEDGRIKIQDLDI